MPAAPAAAPPGAFLNSASCEEPPAIGGGAGGVDQRGLGIPPHVAWQGDAHEQGAMREALFFVYATFLARTPTQPLSRPSRLYRGDPPLPIQPCCAHTLTQPGSTAGSTPPAAGSRWRRSAYRTPAPVGAAQRDRAVLGQRAGRAVGALGARVAEARAVVAVVGAAAVVGARRDAAVVARYRRRTRTSSSRVVATHEPCGRRSRRAPGLRAVGAAPAGGAAADAVGAALAVARARDGANGDVTPPMSAEDDPGHAGSSQPTPRHPGSHAERLLARGRAEPPRRLDDAAPWRALAEARRQPAVGAKPAAARHCPDSSQCPCPEQPPARAPEQSKSRHPSEHTHLPSAPHSPCPAHGSGTAPGDGATTGHAATSHTLPVQPAKQAHSPSLHAPLPLQPPGHVRSEHAAAPTPVRPGTHAHSPSTQWWFSGQPPSHAASSHRSPAHPLSQTQPTPLHAVAVAAARAVLDAAVGVVPAAAAEAGAVDAHAVGAAPRARARRLGAAAPPTSCRTGTALRRAVVQAAAVRTVARAREARSARRSLVARSGRRRRTRRARAVGGTPAPRTPPPASRRREARPSRPRRGPSSRPRTPAPRSRARSTRRRTRCVPPALAVARAAGGHPRSPQSAPRSPRRTRSGTPASPAVGRAPGDRRWRPDGRTRRARAAVGAGRLGARRPLEPGGAEARRRRARRGARQLDGAASARRPSTLRAGAVGERGAAVLHDEITPVEAVGTSFGVRALVAAGRVRWKTSCCRSRTLQIRTEVRVGGGFGGTQAHCAPSHFIVHSLRRHTPRQVPRSAPRAPFPDPRAPSTRRGGPRRRS